MKGHPPLAIFPKVNPSLQCSKWLSSSVLIDGEEMEELMKAMGEFWIFRVSGILQMSEGEISKEEFLDCYFHYIEALKSGQPLTDPRLQSYFSVVFTCSIEALYEVVLPNGQKLIKIGRPVIQLQKHRFNFSEADGKFRSMGMGQESIQWGIQFSYPQLYQDAALLVKEVRGQAEFPNTPLFKRLQKWVRDHTAPTPFMVNGKRINVPIRLGKNCFEWINRHPQLKGKGLTVLALK